MFFLYAVLLIILAFFLPAGISWLLSPVIVASGHRNDIAKFIKYANHASFYKEPKAQGELRCFPSVFDEPSKTFSLIVPAYNEQDRITIMLDETLVFMDQWVSDARDSGLTYEIVVVDDGSSDNTADIVYDYIKKVGTDKMRLVSMGANQGKGAAIRRGMLLCRGHYALMVDADGATEISDLKTLYKNIQMVEAQKVIGPWKFEGKFGMSIGSRAHLQGKAVATRQFYRTVLMYGLHFLVWILCSKNVKDTQCGFKLFTRDTVKVLFPNMRLERWAFDIELIILAEKLGIPIVESSVNWQEIPGSKLIQSKLDVVTTSLTMARDMFMVRACYLFNVWKVQDPSSIILERSSESSK